MSLKEGPRSKCGGPAAKAGRRRGRAGNKRRVFAYRFFSTTSWVSQMTSHPRFCFYPLSYSEAGWEDWIKLKIYPPIISFCLLVLMQNQDSFILWCSQELFLTFLLAFCLNSYLVAERALWSESRGFSQMSALSTHHWDLGQVSLPPWAAVPLLETWGVSSPRKLCASLRQDQFPISVALESEPHSSLFTSQLVMTAS